jgi:hypothetical protein
VNIIVVLYKVNQVGLLGLLQNGFVLSTCIRSILMLLTRIMSAEVFEKEATALAKSMADDNGVVNVAKMGEAVAQLSHPFKVERKPFGSIYKMKEDKTLKLDFLEAA